MQKTAPARVPSFATLIGIASAVLSLGLALAMLHHDGNPAFLLIWLACAGAVTAYTRFNHRWLASFERMATQGATATFRSVRGKWDGTAIDVVFRELPDEGVTFDRIAA